MSKVFTGKNAIIKIGGQVVAYGAANFSYGEKTKVSMVFNHRGFKKKQQEAMKRLITLLYLLDVTEVEEAVFLDKYREPDFDIEPSN